MRAVTLLLAGLLLAESGSASAQSAAGSCQARKPLGVSRVLEIETSGAPRFGHQQYKDLSILADGEVVLTFDDGPLRPYTRPVLDALAAHCTKATFFMVGRMAISDPELVREIARRGHTIGTHTWSHQNLRTIGAVAARHEIELGFSAVQRAVGAPIAPFFRFPYLADPAHAQTYLQSRDVGIFSIEVDGYDYRTQEPEEVHRRVISQIMAQRKGIILFHDIQPSTAGALRRILDDLEAKKFKVVHLVAKSHVTTLASFDAQADREFRQRRSIVAAQPLAPRSMVWPMDPPPAGGFAPWQGPGAAPSGGNSTDTPAPNAKPARAKPTEPGWQQRVFER